MWKGYRVWQGVRTFGGAEVAAGGRIVLPEGSTFFGQEAAAEGAIYDVGTYNQLRNSAIPNTIIHHVPSRLRGSELIADYATDRMAGAELGIRLPATEAQAVDQAALRWPGVPDGARQTLAWQIRDLRNYTDAPNSSLKRLIQMNVDKREWDFAIKGDR